jgi:hypothetical protein
MCTLFEAIEAINMRLCGHIVVQCMRGAHCVKRWRQSSCAGHVVGTYLGFWRRWGRRRGGRGRGGRGGGGRRGTMRLGIVNVVLGVLVIAICMIFVPMMVAVLLLFLFPLIPVLVAVW